MVEWLIKTAAAFYSCRMPSGSTFFSKKGHFHALAFYEALKNCSCFRTLELVQNFVCY